VARAAALERQAVARGERVRRLGGSVSAEESQQAETDLDVARGNYRQAVLEAEVALRSARHKQASLDTALQRLKDTRIVAPLPQIDGAATPVKYVICDRNVTVGQNVQPPVLMGAEAAAGLFRLSVVRPLKLVVTVPERHRADVRAGQDVELEVEDHPGKRFAGTVDLVHPSVDRASRTFKVEVRVPNADGRLAPGSFAKAAILTKTDSGAPTVPEEAVVSFAGVTKVFVVEDGKAREVLVRPGVPLVVREGKEARTWVEVEGDLQPGALVVTSGQTRLADGTAVRVRGMTNDQGLMSKE
jgi:RND family efflux transporter MFP subunit